MAERRSRASHPRPIGPAAIAPHEQLVDLHREANGRPVPFSEHTPSAFAPPASYYPPCHDIHSHSSHLRRIGRKTNGLRIFKGARDFPPKKKRRAKKNPPLPLGGAVAPWRLIRFPSSPMISFPLWAICTRIWQWKRVVGAAKHQIPETDPYNAADTLVRYRLGPLAIMRRTGTYRGARRMFLSDLRELGRRPFPETQLTTPPIARFTLRIVKARPNANDRPFEEAVMPRSLRGYTSNFPKPGAYSQLNQLMASYISSELAIGKAQIPRYAPFIVPNITDPPWPVPTTEHAADFPRWNTGRRSVKSRKNQQIPLNSWILYHWRLISPADIVGAWSSFGGIASQFAHLSIVLLLATTESVATALIYDALLCANL